jgi:hypothetical protein
MAAPLDELFEPGWLVADLDRPWDDGGEVMPHLTIRPEEEEEILQSLRGLGYVE